MDVFALTHRKSLMLALLFGFSAMAAGTAMAKPIGEPSVLHGTCSGCVDNGNTTPTGSLQPNFGFIGSPDRGSGILSLATLVPDSAGAQSFSVTGTNTGNGTVAASLFSATPWSGSGTFLADYLDITASPKNSLGAMTTASGGVTSFLVYTADMGTVNFGTGVDPTFSLSAALPQDTLILGFLEPGSCFTDSPNKPNKPNKPNENGCKMVATASSGSLLLKDSTPPPPPNVPEPESMLLLGTGVVALLILRRRRRAASVE